jgi:anthranilate synthase/aminodeoxychorismate synthase-like glutamine amidotransferase
VILLVDIYDSFVHNLARYFHRLGHETTVRRHNAIGVADIDKIQPAAIVFSPGPCAPRHAAGAIEIVREFHQTVPMLGICLGHQIIAAAFGAHVVRAAEPMHGRASAIEHNGAGVFAGLPNPLAAGRYHSLVVDRETLPEEIEVTAWTAAGEVMAIAHRELPIVGLQFHPESILTESGYDLLAGFLRLAGLGAPDIVRAFASELANNPGSGKAASDLQSAAALGNV